MEQKRNAGKEDKMNTEDAGDAVSGDSEISDFIREALQAEDAEAFLAANAKLIETQILPIQADNAISYETSEGGKGNFCVDGMKIGEKKILGVENGDSIDSIRLDVYTLNADHTVTYEVYMPQ